MQVFKNSIWSFNQDKPIAAEHEGSVVVLNGEPDAATLSELLESHDRVVTPSRVHDVGGAYDRTTGESVY